MRIGVKHRCVRGKFVGLSDKNAQLGLPFGWEWLNLQPLSLRRGYNKNSLIKNFYVFRSS